MPYIWSCYVVVKTLRIILYYYLILAFTLILSLYELFLEVVIRKWFNKWTKFFLLVVTSWPSWVHKNRWTDYCCQDLWFLKLTLVYVKDNEKIEVNSLIVVSSWWKFDSTKVDLTIDHLHLTLSSDSNINQCSSINFIILWILFHCENLSLNHLMSTYRLRGASRKSPVFSSFIFIQIKLPIVEEICWEYSNSCASSILTHGSIEETFRYLCRV